ncbi:MAG: hypothetical protein IT356_12500 [Gemmatimonadaceae bacterium]|nr:hypothetical protein [Gemmatimonadaceae bacterium]
MIEVAEVLAAARALRFVREEPVGSNAGQAVEAMLKLTGLGKGQPWCAAFLALVGDAALGARWPLPLTASCVALGTFATAKGCLLTTPAVGDVFLLWYPKLNRFAHTGLVTGDAGQTIEGNTSGGGSREGWGVFERTRTWDARTRFIRWRDLV